MALKALDEDENGLCVAYTPGGPPWVTFVTEAGLYKLISRSRRPEAREFDRWVRHTALPALRKDGVYVVGEGKVATGRPKAGKPSTTACVLSD